MAISNAVNTQTSKRDAIIEVALKINSLRQAVARATGELKNAEYELDYLLASPVEESSPLARVVREKLLDDQDLSLNKRIANLLDANIQRDYSAEEIAEALGAPNLPSV